MRPVPLAVFGLLLHLAVVAVFQLLPPEVVLYTLFARACDPVLGFLKGSGQYTNEQIIDMVLSTCFDGLQSR